MKFNRWLRHVTVVLLVLIASPAFGQVDTATESKPAQEKKVERYEFTVEHQLDATGVKSQGSTGTCWCFASTSFLESELIRQGKGQHDLSEMFIVQNVYKDKAQNYVLRQGKANFSQGALAHDFVRAAMRHGLMPEQAFNGLDEGAKRHDHGEMETVLKGMLDAVIKRPNPSKKWPVAFSRVLDTYLGAAPKQFSYEGRTYTPKEFANSLGFNAKDYVNITSFNHHPFNEEFVLEIPDNYSNGSFLNLPIDDVMDIIANAVENGYTLAWDGDVSERGFSSGKGLAVLPVDAERRFAMQRPVKEMDVTQEMRQENFNRYVTTDDHLMHLTGIATDQNGKRYFIIKNSWGEIGEKKGYLYMSENYARLKTVAILVHKDAIPEKLRKKN